MKRSFSPDSFRFQLYTPMFFATTWTSAKHLITSAPPVIMRGYRIPSFLAAFATLTLTLDRRSLRFSVSGYCYVDKGKVFSLPQQVACYVSWFTDDASSRTSINSSGIPLLLLPLPLLLIDVPDFIYGLAVFYTLAYAMELARLARRRCGGRRENEIMLFVKVTGGYHGCMENTEVYNYVKIPRP